MYKNLFSFTLLLYFLFFFCCNSLAQIKDYGTLVIKTTSPNIEILSPKNQHKLNETTIIACLKEGRTNISWRQNNKLENKSIEIKSGQITTIDIGTADGELTVIADRQGVSLEIAGQDTKESLYAGEKVSFSNLKLGQATLIARVAGKKDIVQNVNISNEPSLPINVGWDDATIDISFDRPGVELYINNRLEAISSSSGQIICLQNVSSGLKKINAVAKDSQGNKYLLDVEPKELMVEASKTYAIKLTRKDAQLSVNVDRPNVEVTANGITLVSKKEYEELVFPLMLPQKINLTAKAGNLIINKDLTLSANEITKETVSWNDAALVITVDRANVDILLNKTLVATSQVANERLILRNLKPRHVVIDGMVQSLGNNFYSLDVYPKEFDLIAGQTTEVIINKKDAQLIVTSDRKDDIKLLLNNQISPITKVANNVYYFPFMSPGKVTLLAKLPEKPLLSTDIIQQTIDLPVGQTPIEIAWQDLFLFVEADSKLVNIKVNGKTGEEIRWQSLLSKPFNRKVYVFALKPHETAEISWEIEGKKVGNSSFIIKDFIKSQGVVLSN